MNIRNNILFILTDQQRFDTISEQFNNFDANTPGMDSLVKRGVYFENAYCTSPICCPARATLLTGLHPTKAGVPDNISPPLNDGINNIAKRLQNTGYQTVYHGKSHLKGDLKNLGFEVAYENSEDFSTVLEASRFWRNRDWVVEKHRPFFHIVSLLNPHDIYFLDSEKEDPVELPPWPNQDDSLDTKPWPQRLKAINNSPERWQYYRNFYREKIEKVDTNIVELLDQLRCSGFASNTWIIFSTDHGDMAGEHGIGFKGPFMYDGVLRVPLIIAPPDSCSLDADKGKLNDDQDFKPFSSNALVSQIDIVPTIMELAGVSADTGLPGESLMPIVRGECKTGHDAVFAEWHEFGKITTPIRTIRTLKWKYNIYLGNGEELYDLQNDPAELDNLADNPQYAETKELLKQQLTAHLKKENDDFFKLEYDTEKKIK